MPDDKSKGHHLFAGSGIPSIKNKRTNTHQSSSIGLYDILKEREMRGEVHDFEILNRNSNVNINNYVHQIQQQTLGL